jgi:phosphohistidine swiveling domain-containing protein
MTIPALDPEQYVRLFSLQETFITAIPEINERMKMHIDGYPDIEVLYIDGEWFFKKADIDQFRLSAEELHSVIGLIEERCNDFVKHSEAQLIDCSQLSTQALVQRDKEMRRFWANLLRVIDIPVYAGSHVEERVHRLLLEEGFSETDLDILAHPLYNTYHQRRQRDLCMVKLDKLSRREFKEWWRWSQMTLFSYHEVDDAFIDEQLSRIEDPIEEIKKLEDKHFKGEQQYKNLYGRISRELQAEADSMQALIRIRDWRFEQAIRAAYNYHGLLCELAARLGTDYKGVTHMLPEEIANGTIPEDLQERIKGFAYLYGKLYTGKDVEMLKQLFNPSVKKNEILGKGVSAGVATGPARIVRSPKDFHKIQQGDVIVCDMTSPEFNPVLSKVVAIVANIGGFVSHSAIISREFGIPCVVGAGNATNAFSDGDLLEVDGTEGRVKKK